MPLSICTTCYNRTIVKVREHVLEPFPSCLRSINKLAGDVELIVADWNSTDAPIEETLDEHLDDIPYKIVKLEGEFCRNEGLNRAYEESSGDILFFIDCDIVMRDKAVQKAMNMVESGCAVFPMVFGFTGVGIKRGLWCTNDYKNLMIQREVFEKIGSWNVKDEDGKFMLRMCRGRIGTDSIIREKERGFLHHWHPWTKRNIWTRRQK